MPCYNGTKPWYEYNYNSENLDCQGIFSNFYNFVKLAQYEFSNFVKKEQEMFKEIFINLCNKKGVAPSAVCMQLGLSNATYSKWTDDSIPRRATLQKIADYFGVTVNELLGDEQKEDNKKELLEDQLKVALFGGDTEVTDEMWNEVKRYAEFIKSNYGRK